MHFVLAWRVAPMLLFLAVWTAAPARAQEALRGVALVIGQSAYGELPALDNPATDARAIDRLLSDLGFDVDAVLDGDARRLTRALERFAEDAADADVALVYYAGHGVEAGGENFLVPVDARPPAAGTPGGWPVGWRSRLTVPKNLLRWKVTRCVFPTLTPPWRRR